MRQEDRTPAYFMLSVGVHVLDLSAPGHQTLHRSIEITPGPPVRLNLELIPVRPKRPWLTALSYSTLAAGVGLGITALTGVGGVGVFALGEAVRGLGEAARALLALGVGDSGARGRLYRELRHPAPVYQVAFEPGGRWLYTMCEDGKVRRFSVPGGRELSGLLGDASPMPFVAAVAPDPHRGAIQPT